MSQHRDHFDFPEDDDDDAHSVTCDRCGVEDLHWESVTSPDGRSERFVLFDDNLRKHVCAPSADDFEVVP